MRILGLAVIGICLAACAHHHGDDAGDDGSGSLDGLVSIEVKPADAVLVIGNGVAATEDYHAIGTFQDGSVTDITGSVAFSLQNQVLGSFDTAATLTTTVNLGGQTQVLASANSISGATGVTIQLQESYTDPGSTGLPTDPSQSFTGPADPTRAPTLVYPNDGVLLPPNLGKLEFHFLPGAGNTVFALHFKNAVVDLTVYLGCTNPTNGGCIYQPDDTVWQWLSQSNRGGDAVMWSIDGADAASTGVGSSGAQSLAFTPEDLTGGIYYWTTTLEAVMRYDFASDTQTTAEQFLGTELSGGACIGCHALSKDGTKLVAEAGGQNDGRTLLLDVATKTAMVPFGSTTKSNFESWAPDGSQFVGVYADNGATNYNLMLFDGSTAANTSTIDVGGTAANPLDHPDWAADGSRIAFERVGTAQTLQRSYGHQIEIVTNSGGTWGAPAVLVPRQDGKNRYYPAFAPDNRLLVFDESTCTNGNTGDECDGDTDPTATLFAIDSQAGGAAVAMDHANAPGYADHLNTALTSSFPKWNPFVWVKNNAGGHIGWMTFSSTRQYGLKSPPGAGTLLWMVAVDLDAAPGTDPSYAAFALPFQDFATSNHIAQWTTQIVNPE
ncbi:MAG TPA: hypothetical protein VGM88_10695 [Kofleriaceae bacterium]|jgi:hypothetical protein